MFARATPLFLFALPLLAAASAVPRTDPAPSQQCNTGPIQCCKSVQKSDSKAVTDLAGLLGIVLGGVTGLVGLTCSPISVLAIQGNSCSSQPVCCTNNQFNGLIAIGCTPINVNL